MNDSSSLSELGEFLKGCGIAKKDIRNSGLPALLYGSLYTTHETVIRSTNSYVTKDVAAGSTIAQQGDILFPTSGETADEIGRPAVIDFDEEVYVGGDVVIFRPTVGNPKFISYQLNSERSFRYRAKVAQGQSVVHIYKKQIGDHSIWMPDEATQVRAVKVLEACAREIHLLNQRVDLLKQQKKGLMQQLLTGKIRVKLPRRAK